MHRWFLRTFLALAMAQLWGCAAHTADHRPAAAAERVPARSGSLRVMSFNVHSCSEGLDRVAAAIREAEPDIVALQEVDNGTSRSSGLDQARELADRLGFPYAAHIPATRMHGGDYGMALLSRLPVQSVSQRALPVDRGMEPRVLGHAVVLVQGVEVSLYKAHLSPMPQRSRLRLEQARYVNRIMARDPRPKILVGDLNDVATSPAVQLLTRRMRDSWAAAGSGPAGTYPLPIVGTFRYDYVLASDDFEIRRAFVLPGSASDHHPIVSDLELPAARIAETD